MSFSRQNIDRIRVAALVLVGLGLFVSLIAGYFFYQEFRKEYVTSWWGNENKNTNQLPSQNTTFLGNQISLHIVANDPNGSELDVRQGQNLRIQASGTIIWFNTTTNPRECCTKTASPDGYDISNLDNALKAQYAEDMKSYLCPTALKGALIARFNGGPWFLIGEKYNYKATKSGTLKFSVNEVKFVKSKYDWMDNSGEFLVKIETESNQNK